VDDERRAVRHSCGLDAVAGGVVCENFLNWRSCLSKRKISCSTSSVALAKPSLLAEPDTCRCKLVSWRLGSRMSLPPLAEGLPLFSPELHLTTQHLSTCSPQVGQPAGVVGKQRGHQHMWTQGTVTTEAVLHLHMLQRGGLPVSGSRKVPMSTLADTTSRQRRQRAFVW